MSLFLTRSYSELSRKMICVVMHDTNPWTLEKWHVRLALRNLGVMVDSDDSVSFKAVRGPSPDLQGKELCVRLKVNQLEDIRLRLKNSVFVVGLGTKKSGSFRGGKIQNINKPKKGFVR